MLRNIGYGLLGLLAVIALLALGYWFFFLRPASNYVTHGYGKGILVNVEERGTGAYQAYMFADDTAYCTVEEPLKAALLKAHEDHKDDPFFAVISFEYDEPNVWNGEWSKCHAEGETKPVGRITSFKVVGTTSVLAK
jgi:hypothetical protein